jgi:hypothetical protein
MSRPKGDNVGVKLRLATSLVAKLEASAKRSGVSFNHEAVQRIAKSYAEENAFGGEEGRRVIYAIATAFIMTGTRAAGGRKPSAWLADAKVCDRALLAVVDALLTLHPGISSETLLIAESIKSRIASRLVNQPKQKRQRQENAA